MRRLIAGLVAPLMLASPNLASPMLGSRAAMAQADMRCLSPEERSAVALAALRSELMVLATACHDDDQYNAFVRKYQPDLLGNEAAIGDLLKREYGTRAQAEHDRFTTEMANAESSAGMRLGEDFCAHDGMLFDEVMALESPSELGSYAAGKDLVPSTLRTCPEPPQQSPARKVVGRASAKGG
jgi:hypothetical protein